MNHQEVIQASIQHDFDKIIVKNHAIEHGTYNTQEVQDFLNYDPLIEFYRERLKHSGRPNLSWDIVPAQDLVSAVKEWAEWE